MSTTPHLNLDDEAPEPPSFPPPEAIGQGADEEAVITRKGPGKPSRAGQQLATKSAGDQARMGPHRSPPYSAEAEEHVIACCLLDGDKGLTLRRALDAGLTPDSFYLPANRIIFEVASSLADPALDLVISELQTRRQLDAVGGLPYLMQVTGKIPTTAHAGHFIEKVRERAVLRQFIRDSEQAVESAYGFTGDLDQLLQVTQARVEALSRQSAPAAARKSALLADLRKRRVVLTSPPPEPQTRLFLAGKPVATPGNLTTLISRAKTGKTATIGGAVAAVVAAHYDRHDLDTLGFTAPHTTEAVILLDTEQSPYDAWTCHQRTMARADQAEMPPWLHHHALVGYSALQLRETLPVVLDHARDAHQGIFTLILDGVADFVSSVNDEAECNAFVAHLHGLAVDYNCAIICVIHSNEGLKNGDDGRGHLGKQLTRKAESNLLLKKTGEVTTITSDKQRKAPITEKDGIAFEWSEEFQRHILTKNRPEESGAKGGRPVKYDPDLMIACVPAPEARPATIGQIHRLVGELPCGISIRAFKDVLARWVANGEVKRVKDVSGYGFRRSS